MHVGTFPLKFKRHFVLKNIKILKNVIVSTDSIPFVGLTMLGKHEFALSRDKIIFC